MTKGQRADTHNCQHTSPAVSRTASQATEDVIGTASAVDRINSQTLHIRLLPALTQIIERHTFVEYECIYASRLSLWSYGSCFRCDTIIPQRKLFSATVIKVSRMLLLATFRWSVMWQRQQHGPYLQQLQSGWSRSRWRRCVQCDSLNCSYLASWLTVCLLVVIVIIIIIFLFCGGQRYLATTESRPTQCCFFNQVSHDLVTPTYPKCIKPREQSAHTRIKKRC